VGCRGTETEGGGRTRGKTEKEGKAMTTKIIIGMWAALVFLMCLIPPWDAVFSMPRGMYGLKETHNFDEAYGYFCLFDPPLLDRSTSPDSKYFSLHVSWRRLFLEILSVSFLAGGLISVGYIDYFKARIENKRLKRDLEKLEIQREINKILDGPDEI
jgi:hypothetical protein